MENEKSFPKQIVTKAHCPMFEVYRRKLSISIIMLLIKICFRFILFCYFVPKKPLNFFSVGFKGFIKVDFNVKALCDESKS